MYYNNVCLNHEGAAMTLEIGYAPPVPEHDWKNKEYVKAYNKVYYLNHKSKMNAQAKQYRQRIYEIPYEEIVKHIQYNPVTGLCYKGDSIFPIQYNKKGYGIVHLFGREQLLHRVVWFLVHKEWVLYIDHIDGDKTNNRIDNLRPCGNRENSLNRELHRNGRLPGAVYSKSAGKWYARYRDKNGVQQYLGSYETEREASLMVCKTYLQLNLVRREFLPSTFTDAELGIEPTA